MDHMIKNTNEIEIEPQHNPKKKTFAIMGSAIVAFLASIVAWFVGKRKIFLVIFLIGILIIVIHLLDMIFFGKSILYKRMNFASNKISSDINDYKIAFVTDLHEISHQDLQNVVDKINQEKVDALLIGGDFAQNQDFVDETIRILSATKTNDGIFAVEGNHDRYKQAFATMREYGIVPLDNTGVELKGGLFLAGVQDLWNRDSDLLIATEDAKADDFVLVLSHNPDVAMQQEEVNVDLMLSGHIHGGQITFFGFFAPAIYDVSSYGHRFLSGWRRGVNNRQIYISRGTGWYKKIPRVFARPEVDFITLKHQD